MCAAITTPSTEKEDKQASSHLPDGMDKLFLSYAQLCKRASGTRWIVKGIVPANAIGIVFGESGTYKSFIALDLALHIAHGLPWCNCKSTDGTVLYIAGEGGIGIKDRIEAWHKHNNLDPNSVNYRVCIIPQLLNKSEATENIKEEMVNIEKETGNISLLIVDTLSQNYDGDENDTADVANLFRNLNVIIRSSFPNCTVLMIHHTGHSSKNRPRGSSAITANTDFVYSIEAGQQTAIMKCTKMRDSEPSENIFFEIIQVNIDLDESNEPRSSLVAVCVEEQRTKLKKEIWSQRYSKHLFVLIKALRFQNEPITEIELRSLFNQECDASLKQDSKNKAFKRALTDGLADGVIKRTNSGLLYIEGTREDYSG